MQRALVIRTYGDQDLANAMACSMKPKRTMESYELKRLRAQVGIRNYLSEEECRRKIAEIPIKYPIKRISPIKQKLWAL